MCRLGRPTQIVIADRQRTEALAGGGKKIAFTTAAAIGGIAGSPAPPHTSPPLGTR